MIGSLIHGLIARAARLHMVAIGIILALGAAGVMMLYSASGGELRPWALPHFVRFLMSFGLMLLIAIMPIRWLLKCAYPFYGICFLMLVAVEIAGQIGMGAQRWINLGVINLQPSEMMKVGLILALARYCHIVQQEHLSRLGALLPALLLIAAPAVLILIQPNLGTTLITLAIAAAILFMAGLDYRYFLGAGGGLIAALPIAWEFLHDYQKRRVLTFLDPTQDPLGAGYNIMQSIIAIGSGGLQGKGLLQGSQGQLNFLPEKQTDFIFTMLAEETGFIGAALLLFLYALLLIFGIRIALRSKHRFGALLAVGVTAMLFVHILVNVGMVMGLMPVVGVPLPFLSYGGSFLIATMLAMGLLLNARMNQGEMLERGSRI